MRIKAEIMTEGWIFHVLIHKCKAGIWIAIDLLPFIIAVSLAVISEDKACRVIRDQMGYIRIMTEYRTIIGTGFQGVILWI